MIWGPRDESPLGDGSRLRDSQCGLFATGKVLRRFRCKFTYLPMCRLEDQEFYEGIRRFLATVNIIKELKDLTILQIATRPSGFWTMMVNEGELLEKFNIKIHPVTLAEVKDLSLIHISIIIKPLLAGGWQAAVLQVVCIAIGCLVWYPFFKVSDNQRYKEEISAKGHEEA